MAKPLTADEIEARAKAKADEVRRKETLRGLADQLVQIARDLKRGEDVSGALAEVESAYKAARG